MKNEVQYDTGDYTVRWVSYLDLLGFTDLVKTKDWFDVFSSYNKAVEHCTEVSYFTPKIEKTWFSDTFLLYSPDNTASSFVEIESTTRLFTYYLISAGIPVRGAMSCGDFYADKETNIFFGPAIIEAYHYGENQDWIGFVLTPSAVKQMAVIGLHANNMLNYTYWDIPYKKAADCASARILQKSLPAYIIGGHLKINGRNLCLDKLYKMKGKLKDDSLIRKYENTINFILKNQKNTG
jgi:hypothetical protein